MSNPTPQTRRPLDRPTFPTLHSSAGSTTSSYQSRSSVSTLASPSPSSASSAPLPSPSFTQQPTDGFFGSLNQQQRQQQHQYQFQQQQQRQFAPQNQTSQAPPTSDYCPNRQGAGSTATETNNSLNNFDLLAEAAKRAQMACLMRDMEGVEL